MSSILRMQGIPDIGGLYRDLDRKWVNLAIFRYIITLLHIQNFLLWFFSKKYSAIQNV
jgi:hypothetical protein